MKTENETAEREWTGRPVLARVVRVLVLAVPFVAVTAGAWRLNRQLGLPASLIEATARWAVLSVISTMVLIAIDRAARRHLPLSTLLQLSIVFPDHAPSRFKMALRRGTTKQLAQEVASLDNDSAQEAAECMMQIVSRLTAHDRLTRGHTERVRAYTDLIAAEMELLPEERLKLQWAALLHDIGKLTVPSDVLNKRAKLSDREWKRLQTHPAEGWKMVQPMRGWLGEWARGARDHHERWDGTGYPRGTNGTEISRAGRIISVADAFDVMTSVRAYKTAMDHDDARAELAACAGTQFDPDVVRAFLSASLVPKNRGRIGAWLANSPVAVQASGAASVPAAATSAVAALFAATSVMLPAMDTQPDQAAAERVVEEVTTTTTSVDDVVTTTVVPTTPTTTTADTTSTTVTVTTTTSPPRTTVRPATPAIAAVPTIPVTPTTAAPPPSTTAAPPTTTEAPIESTTTTTTTLAPSTFAGGFLGGGSGSPRALVGSVSGSGATNWDSAANTDPGITLTSGPSGLAELDAAHVAAWSLPIAADTRLVGTGSLRLHVATPDFATGPPGGLAAGISDCASGLSSCTTIASGQVIFTQDSFGADFGVATVNFGAIDYTVPAGHSLVVSMTVPQAMANDTWLAFGTADHPSQFRLT
ncbi:MAG: HD-GYP domain-containing protein [Acidimicrobiales bacterium]